MPAQVVGTGQGKVKWFNGEKGFGFLSRDDGGDVFVHSSVLPAGVETLKPGQRVEFGVVAGQRGDQALSVVILDPTPSVAAAQRKNAGARPLPRQGGGRQDRRSPASGRRPTRRLVGEAVAEVPSPQLLEHIRRQRRHTLELLTVCAVGLVPWTILLAFTLPSGYTAPVPLAEPA